mgnify:CR=1 FL=1
MANWKKVIVSGSNAHLHHITASGDVSASGKLFGNLPVTTDIPQVVVYNTTTGRLEWKVLNLINTSPAPSLFAADQSSPADNNTDFKLSHAPGNTSLVGSSIFPYTQLSASINGGSTYAIKSASNIDYPTLNGTWSDKDITDKLYYSPSTNLTASFLLKSGSRDGLDINAEAAVARTFRFQSINNTNTAVPSYDSSAANLNYGNRAFKNGGVGDLEFYVNSNSTPVRTVALSFDYNATSSNMNGIQIDLFATQSNLDSTTGDPDTTKHYRSGSFIVQTTHQRDGYNFAYAIHTGSIDGVQFANITNFSEWFYDFEGAKSTGNMTVLDQGIKSNPAFDMTATSSISGIKFFDDLNAGASASYGAKVTNQYKNTYKTSNGISFGSLTQATIEDIEVTQSGYLQVVTWQLSKT